MFGSFQVYVLLIFADSELLFEGFDNFLCLTVFIERIK